MIKKLLPALSLIIALAMVVVMIVPVFADRAPANANNNNLQISLAADPSPTPPGGGPYHVGDTIPYQVIVNVPFFVSGNLTPAWQSGISVSFDPIVDDYTNPNANAAANHVDDTTLITGLDLLPGEQVIFTSNNAHYTRYLEEAGKPTRAQLTATSSNFTMPSDANFVDSDVAGSYPILDHVIGAGNPPNEIAAYDMFLFNGLWEEQAIARVWNVEGSHSSDSFIDSNDKLTSITVPISIPGTHVTLASQNGTIVDEGQSVTFTVTEANTGDVNLTSPYVRIMKGGVFYMDLVAPPNGGGDIYTPTGTLNGSLGNHAETWTWTFDSGPISGPTTFSATGHGLDDSYPDAVDITAPDYEEEFTEMSINSRSPHTKAGITASANAYHLPIGGDNVDLTFTEQNNGLVNLSNVRMDILKDGVAFAPYTPLQWPPTIGDNGNHILDIGETWSWTIPNVFISADTTFVATGYGEYGNPPVAVTYPPMTDEYATLSLIVPPPQETPGLSDWGIGLLIAGLAGVMIFFGYRRMRRSQS